MLWRQMADRYEALSGWRPEPGSDLGVRMQTLAYQLAGFYRELEALQGNLFPDTAQGEYLDRHGACRGIPRKEAMPATGMLTFRRETGEGEKAIPAGTVCSVKSPEMLRYRTTEEGLMGEGETSCTLPCVCLRPGRLGNQLAGRVTVVDMLLPGVTVTNEAAMQGGCDREEDEPYRRRILEAFSPLSNGANLAFYRDTALACPGVGSCGVSFDAGQLTVAIWGELGEAPSAETIWALQQRLESLREINTTLQVQAAAAQAVTLQIEAMAAPHAQPAVALERCREEALRYLQELGVGKPLLRAALCCRLMALPEILNCRILAPTADQPCPATGVLTAGDVTVSAMEPAV